MTARFTITGIAEIQTALQDFTEFGERGLSLSVVRAGMTVIASQMREDLKPQVQHVGQEVGYRFDRKSGASTVVGKVGVGVGRNVVRPKQNRGSQGVGINAGNFHWWVLGSYKTGQRRTTKSRANRGRLEAQQPGFAMKSRQRAQQKAKAAMEAALEKSIVKYFKRNA